MNIPNLAEGRPPNGNRNQSHGLGKDAVEEIRKEVANLQSEDLAIAAKATASIFILANRSEASPHLGAAVSKLVNLLSSSNLYCQRNACAALTAIIQTNESLFSTVCNSHGLGASLVEALNSEDTGLRLNSSSALGTLAQRLEGLETITVSHAEDAIIQNLRVEKDDKVLEASMDAICAIASHDFQRPTLIQKDIVPTLAGLMKVNNSEIQVRALLALGMLTGSSREGQQALTNADGAIIDLVSLTRSSDNDVKGIAKDIFGTLVQNSALRPVVEEKLRQHLESTRAS